jgi:hypothetical protein
VDPNRCTVTAQAGCLLGDVHRETQLHGLVTSDGFVFETGWAGLTPGGGFGYLTRQFGWTVDNLLEVDIVTADGQVLHASRDENADVFWATHGGGGNSGIVSTSSGPLPVRSNAISVPSANMTAFISCIPLFPPVRTLNEPCCPGKGGATSADCRMCHVRC